MTVDPDKFINERAAKRPTKSGNSGRRGDYGADEPRDSPEWKQKNDAGLQGHDRNNGGGRNGGKRRRGRAFTRLLSSGEFMGRWQPPDWVVDGVLTRGSVYTLTGNTNAGKTLAALRFAHAVASGGGFAGRLSQQGEVAFFAGENPDNVRIQWMSLCHDLGIDPASLPIHWYEGTFSLEQALQQVNAALRSLPSLTLWIADSLQSYFEGDDDSHNMQMLDAAKNFRRLSEGHPNRPAGIILAHPGKNAGRDQLIPRGGSSVVYELDGNLTCWRDGDLTTIHWLGKIRNVPFDPILFEHALVQPPKMVDARGHQMLGPVLRPVLPERSKEIIKETKSRKVRILAFVRANPLAIHQEIASHIGASRATAQRAVQDLIKARWIKKYADRLVVTREGNEVLNDANLPSQPAPEM